MYTKLDQSLTQNDNNRSHVMVQFKKIITEHVSHVKTPTHTKKKKPQVRGNSRNF